MLLINDDLFSVRVLSQFFCWYNSFFFFLFIYSFLIFDALVITTFFSQVTVFIEKLLLFNLYEKLFFFVGFMSLVTHSKYNKRMTEAYLIAFHSFDL